MSRDPYHIDIEINSEKKSVAKIETLVVKLRETYDISDERFYNLMVAITEAVNNAVIHGNKKNPNKKIRFSLRLSDDIIYIEVEDQGGGFDPGKVADPREPENLLKDSGRGVFLIRTLMDECTFEKTTTGTKVTMSSRIR